MQTRLVKLTNREISEIKKIGKLLRKLKPLFDSGYLAQYRSLDSQKSIKEITEAEYAIKTDSFIT